MNRLENAIEREFKVEVVRGKKRRSNALVNVGVRNNKNCNKLIKETLDEIEEAIEDKFNRRRANACMRKPRRKRSTPKSTSSKSSKDTPTTSSSSSKDSTSKDSTPTSSKSAKPTVRIQKCTAYVS